MKSKSSAANMKNRISVSTSLDGNPKNVLDKLREQSRKEQEAKPEDRVKEMFSLDRGLLDSLVLPSKVEKVRTITSQRLGKSNARDQRQSQHPLNDNSRTSTMLPNQEAKPHPRELFESNNEYHQAMLPSSDQDGDHAHEDGGDAVDHHLKNSNAVSKEFSFLPNIIGISTLQQNLGSESRDSGNPQGSSQEASGDEFTDDVSAILSTLHTADDAVNYFARYGSETPIKFIHLISKESREFNPYDLMVTTQNEITSEHYVMTSSGSSHPCRILLPSH
jgi:hypothetical protein